jgi:phage regulator Rha-like protein
MKSLTTAIIQTMSSREIATLTEKPHDNVLKLVRSLIDGGIVKNTTPREYTHHQNKQTYIEYFSDKRDSLVIVARLSPEFTAVIVDRWQELEGTHIEPNLLQMQEQSLRLTVSAMEAAKAYGFNGNHAVLSADKAIKAMTGVSVLALMSVELVKEQQLLNLTATDIGKQLRPALSAIKTNLLLQDKGYQEKLGAAWSPTEKGKPYALFLDTGKKHSDGTPVTQLKWLSSIIEHLNA